jgi:hypothetical protein
MDFNKMHLCHLIQYVTYEVKLMKLTGNREQGIPCQWIVLWTLFQVVHGRLMFKKYLKYYRYYILLFENIS